MQFACCRTATWPLEWAAKRVKPWRGNSLWKDSVQDCSVPLKPRKRNGNSVIESCRMFEAKTDLRRLAARRDERTCYFIMLTEFAQPCRRLMRRCSLRRLALRD